MGRLRRFQTGATGLALQSEHPAMWRLGTPALLRPSARRWLAPLAAMLLLACLASCDTRNIGTKAQPDTGPVITSFTVTSFDPPYLWGGCDADFLLQWERGTGPYVVSIDYAQASSSQGQPDTSDGFFQQTVTLADVAASTRFEVIAVVTDSQGLTARTTREIDVGAQRNAAPVIESIEFVDSMIAVTASDPSPGGCGNYDLSLTVSVDSATGGLIISPAQATVAGAYQGTVYFDCRAEDIFAGASGTVTFTLDDGYGGTSTETSGTIAIPGFALPADTLVAVPLASQATVNDTVKVVVATGPTANPFQFMTAVSVVMPPGTHYAGGFDHGAPPAGSAVLNPSEHGDRETVDGIWTAVNPISGFLTVGDVIVVPDTSLPPPWPPGSSAMDFSITTLGGQDAAAGTSGILFNFNLGFDQPGEYRLGFLLFDEINRTYYQDGSQAVYFWGDLSNNNSYNTVTVTP